MQRKLIIGCGEITFESDQERVHPAGIHPKEVYDTINIDNGTYPTYHLDINDYEKVKKKFKSEKYDLIICERLPICQWDDAIRGLALSFKNEASQACAYLLNAKGMLGMIAGSASHLKIKNICQQMQEVGFKSVIIKMPYFFFFKQNNFVSLHIFRNFLETDNYLKDILSKKIIYQYKGKDEIQLNEKNAIHFIWDIPELISKLPSEELKFPERYSLNQLVLTSKEKKLFPALRNQLMVQVEVEGKTQADTIQIESSSLDFKISLISFIFSCHDNISLMNLYAKLWDKQYDFLRETEKYSRYYTTYQNKTMRVRHTWIEIERALSIQVLKNIIKKQQDNKLEIGEIKKIESTCAFIKPAKKALLFKTGISSTYKILSGNSSNAEKMLQLETRQQMLQKFK